MSAVDEYRKHTRVADEILSEQYATTLKVASVSREYADAAIAKLEEENERLRAMLHVAWQRGGQAWNWPEDEWLALLERRVRR